ncbi:protein TIFY 5A [Prosopis cineraria]|uniref:protein TIFY 5A n=1 Tax=Prosopis cineraria TaxID=364024 RepID=UPI0024109DE1|nr:protein TIFY 5A [Prosopis cineraria]
MRRNCNLELRLFPSGDSSHLHEMTEQDSESPQQNLQKLTIFYDGKMCICDVTELQARSILMLANREMKGRARTPNGSEPSSPNTVPSYSPSSGLSMKRSLQSFLQKRKNRILEASPYHH